MSDLILNELQGIFSPKINLKFKISKKKWNFYIDNTMENSLYFLYAHLTYQKTKDLLSLKESLKAVLLDSTKEKKLLNKHLDKLGEKALFILVNSILQPFNVEQQKYVKCLSEVENSYNRTNTKTKKNNRQPQETSIIRMFLYLMNGSKGAIKTSDILKMTPNAFFNYQKNIGFISREKSEDGQKINDGIVIAKKMNIGKEGAMERAKKVKLNLANWEKNRVEQKLEKKVKE